MMTVIVQVPDLGLADREKVQEAVRVELLKYGLRNWDRFMLTVAPGKPRAAITGGWSDEVTIGLDSLAVEITTDEIDKANGVYCVGRR